jgi:hypothetical protein
MSSPGSISVNSGPFVFRTYESEYINHNTYLIQKYDYPVSSNRVLITSTNGLLAPSDKIYVSSITTSSLFSNVISTNNIYVSSYAFSTFDVSTLVISSLIVSSINTNTLSYSTLLTNTLSTSYLFASSFSVDTVFGSSLIGSSITVSSLTTSSLTSQQILFSSLIGSSIIASSVYLSTFSGPTANVSSNFNNNIIVSSVFVSTLINSTIAVSSMYGCTISVYSAYATSFFSNFFTVSTFSQDQFNASFVLASSIITNDETSYILTGTLLSSVTTDTNIVRATNLFFSTLDGSTMFTGQMYTTSTTVNVESFSTLFVSTLLTDLCSASFLQASTIFYSTITGSSMTVSTLQPTSLTGNHIGISTLITNTVTADMINTSQLFVSTISLNSFLTNQAVYGQTLKKTSMVALRTITINSTIITNDINAQLDNPPSIPQVYTFGPTIPNRWVRTGGNQNGLMFSSDGLNWNPCNPVNIFAAAGRGVAWNGSLWVAVGSGTNGIATSTNGIDWVGLGPLIFTIGIAVEWGNNLWVAVGVQTIGNISYSIATSPNGINWTLRSVSSPQDPNLFTIGRGIAWNGSLWVGVGGNGGANDPKIFYSNNGDQWTEASAEDSPYTSTSIFSNRGSDVAWNGTLWVAVGEGTVNSIAYSYDGASGWIGLGKPGISDGLCVAWNGTLWVVGGVGAGGGSPIVTSFNGLTWTAANIIGFVDVVRSVAWNGAMWIANGDFNTGFNINAFIIYSYDGINWTLGGSAGTSGILGIAYNYRRPYTLTFPTNSNVATIGNISGATFPITISQNEQLDICSDSYYNKGYTNFSMTIRGQFS